jgi:hypothetical protein
LAFVTSTFVGEPYRSTLKKNYCLAKCID